ncbi:hypothetical protein QBC43DRAFT_284419 [Cladorrhinum sp. PSN259]|nr:hypothetical protein QBC43DRAFT_284419 [Cladorrhinum sp. PSN259]
MAVKTVLLFCALVCPGGTTAIPYQNVRPRQAKSAMDAKVKLRRAFHFSAVMNGWLYFDGGEFASSTEGTVVYQHADIMVSIDLRKDWTNESVTLRSSPKPTNVLSLKNGGIWVGHNKGVLYTDFSGTESTFGDNIIYLQGLWSFTPDGSGGGSWENLNKTANPSFVDLPRPYINQVASGNGLGFFLKRFVGNDTSKYTTLSSLTTYNLGSHELTNLTVTGVSNRGLDQMGGMIFVPNFGNQGILVNMGGDQDGRVEADDLVSFRRVQVYDPEKQRWFEQKTTGEIPQPRKGFCIASAPSANHTYEILVYAGCYGELGSAAIHYDSAFVLTIPGFYWLRSKYKPENPRHGLTCDLVGGSQVLIIGGVDSTQHNATNSEDDYDGVFDTPAPFTGLAVFDSTRLRFVSSHTAKQDAYKSAPEIRAYYNARGNKPESGFASPALEALLSVQNFDDNPPPGSNAEAIARKSNAGAIAGGVVGGVGGLAMLIWLAVCLRRRRNRTQALDSPVSLPACDLALTHATQGNVAVAPEAFHVKHPGPPSTGGGQLNRHEMPAVQGAPTSLIPQRPELPSQWPVVTSKDFQDKPGEETHESRQEMPVQDMRAGRAEMAQDNMAPGRQDLPRERQVAELPGITPPAEFLGHGQKISELGERIHNQDGPEDTLADERTRREKKQMDTFKFPDSFESPANDGSGLDGAGSLGVSPSHGGAGLGATGDGGGDGGGG